VRGLHMEIPAFGCFILTAHQIFGSVTHSDDTPSSFFFFLLLQ
jgi:hypothetical protein